MWWVDNMELKETSSLHKDADFQLALFRALFLCIGASYLALGDHLGLFKLPQHQFVIYVAGFTSYTLIMLGSIVVWRFVTWRRYLSVILDISLVTIGLIFSGGAESPIFLLYIWLILAQSLRKRRSLIYLAQATALTQYLFVIYMDVVAGKPSLASAFVVLTLIFLPLNMNIFYRIMVHARETADQASKAKSRFLANMSHELRTPLNAIIGYSEMLTENAESRKDHRDVEDLNRVRDSGYFLLDLINEILDISKIEAGKMEIHPERFDVSTLLDEITDTVNPLMQIHNNKLIVDTENDIASIYTDKKKLRQTLLNLLSNAAKFTHDGTITLRARSQNINMASWVEFSVVDTGVGVHEHRLQYLFEPFTYAETTEDKKFSSTGLGLAISKRFCEMLGGSIKARSEPGKGSEFTICLPAELVFA